MTTRPATQPRLSRRADRERTPRASRSTRPGKTTVESLPAVVTFALTTFCNNMLPCVICDRNIRMRICDRECDERVIRAMAPILKTARKVLLHCGGEAMFSKHFDSVVAGVEPPTRVSFATNAMLMMRSRAERMLERDIMSRLVVSMDAATPEVYRIMRPSCKFEVVTRNVRYYTGRAKALGR